MKIPRLKKALISAVGIVCLLFIIFFCFASEEILIEENNIPQGNIENLESLGRIIKYPSNLTMVPKYGVLYVFGVNSPDVPAYRKRYKEKGGKSNLYGQELLRSMQSLKDSNPQIPFAIISDSAQDIPEMAAAAADYVIEIASAKSPWGEKELSCLSTPFERTLFLDLDTVICDNQLAKMFKLLDNFDMAIIQESMSKNHFLSAHDNNVDMLAGFHQVYEINSGVFMFKKNERTFEFFRKVIEKHKSGSDQHYYHLTSEKGILAKLDIKFLILPVEFNFRYHGGLEPIYLKGKVKIIHSRYTNCSVVNRITTPRLFDPLIGDISLSFKADSKSRTWEYIIHPSFNK